MIVTETYKLSKLNALGRIPLAGLLLLATVSTSALAQSGPEGAMPGNILEVTVQSDTPSQPFQLMQDESSAGFDFDMAGSEIRKLKLQLNQPLMLSAGSQARVLNNGANLLGLDATLDVPVTSNFSLSAGAANQLGKAQFQSLGSIQCMNGTLRADSYTASGCRFIDEPFSTSESNQFKLGTQFNTENAAASINWFTEQNEFNQVGYSPATASGSAVMLSDGLLNPALGNPLFAPATGDPLQRFNSETSGVDLNFRLGITTDQLGDIRLGLAFTRVLDMDYQGLYASGSDPLTWTVAEPFNTARMDLEWTNGVFSSGVQGYYRDSVEFLNRDGLDSMATFDVHFTWRTPWNANLSVGASNVLNAGPNETADVQNQPVDPLESIYGRIPYVRYKQDL